MDVIIDDIISQVNLEDKEFIANEPSLGIWSEFVIFFPLIIPHLNFKALYYSLSFSKEDT
jgi:hypothetical protein